MDWLARFMTHFKGEGIGCEASTQYDFGARDWLSGMGRIPEIVFTGVKALDSEATCDGDEARRPEIAHPKFDPDAPQLERLKPEAPGSLGSMKSKIALFSGHLTFTSRSTLR